MELIKDVHVSM